MKNKVEFTLENELIHTCLPASVGGIFNKVQCSSRLPTQSVRLSLHLIRSHVPNKENGLEGEEVEWFGNAFDVELGIAVVLRKIAHSGGLKLLNHRNLGSFLLIRLVYATSM